MDGLVCSSKKVRRACLHAESICRYMPTNCIKQSFLY